MLGKLVTPTADAAQSWKPHWLWFCEWNCGHELFL